MRQNVAERGVKYSHSDTTASKLGFHMSRDSAQHRETQIHTEKQIDAQRCTEHKETQRNTDKHTYCITLISNEKHNVSHESQNAAQTL